LRGTQPLRTLKNLLQEAAVPPWQRGRIPLLFRGEALVWAAGVGVAWEFQAQPGEDALSFSWSDPARSRRMH
jgi:tRNA(Ile)-lysidine synthase